MISLKKVLPIYSLAASLVFLGFVVSANQASAATANVSLSKYNSDMAKVNQRLKDLENSNYSLNNKISALQNCHLDSNLTTTRFGDTYVSINLSQCSPNF